MRLRPFAALLLILATLIGTVPTAMAVPARISSVPPTVPPGSGTGGESISWALGPAGSADGSVASDRPDLTYSSTAGASIPDAVTLYNLGTVQMTFSVYATDAFNDDEGQFQLLGGGEQPTGVGSWVSITQTLITVPAGTQATIPITIDVPANAAPGDYAGGIVASVSTQGAGEQGEAITVERRTGTRIYLRVSGDLQPEMGVVGVETDHTGSLNPFGGTATVRFGVENRGNTRLGGRAQVEVTGPFGLFGKVVTIDEIPELLPGERATLTVELDGVPAALRLSTEVRITPLGVDDASLSTITGRDSKFAPPITLLVFVLVVILVVLVVRWRLRQRALPHSRGRIVDTTSREVEPA